MTLELVEHSYQRRFTPGHYNYHHNVVVRHDSNGLELEHGGGSADRVYVARSGDHFFVLSLNRPLDYVGLSHYDVRTLRTEALRRDSGEDDYMALGPSGDCFFQNTEELPNGFMDLGWMEMIELLQEYI
jgi:hypothetical protein